ncbi:DUF1697 domain-containing protein [Sinisalibacter aestuarii]|uniref:DUF1697 domain-containing protein n=1 Tax=Sinisalibacter aestuarii TaxID=2949426 RepID=A0ABQ5LS35_9RHOB|nr:DUF1697 domain-containing protein [Sinisalibacter aestuarii]GKY87538.1 hypothetical protein STA1M1_14070 [Sinisalibacter aestuarii]
MNAWVLLLRGINVGGNHALRMSDLRALLATLGVRNVASYIQSGNLVFTGVIDARNFGEIVEDEIEAQRGFRPRAMVFSRENFGEIVAAYPWPDAFGDPTSGHIWFLAARPTAPDMDELGKLAASSERFRLTDSAFYLHAPDGIGRSKLAEKVERHVGVAATARNLNTSLKLREMLEGLGEV